MKICPEDIQAVENMKNDQQWDALLQSMYRFGSSLQFGKLQACYIDQGKSLDTVVIPGEETIALSVKKKCFHDQILEIIEK
jgi:hypothetical protein